MRIEFERVSPEAVGIKSEEIENLLNTLENSGTEMHGLMIMRHGKICAEGWWAPYAPGLRHGLQSLTKTYAATAVGIAYTEGLLQLEDKVINIFPEETPDNPCDNLAKMTVRDVLCMGCGMDTMPKPTKDWIRDFLATPVNHEPGTTYMYNSVGSTLLGAIVKKVSGQGLHEYLTPRLFDKIGIDDKNLRWMKMPDGMEVGGGGLFSTTENSLRLMKLYAEGGVWNGERILAEDYVKKATSVQNESASEAANNPAALDNFVGYGFQIWMCCPDGAYRADGAMGQFSIVCPKQDMIISINETASGAHWAQNTLNTVWEFLDTVTEDILPANEESAGHLKRRMNSLAIPNPLYMPLSSIAASISGKDYIVNEGKFVFESTIGAMMSGTPLSDGIKKFKFTFHEDCCDMQFSQDGVSHNIVIAIDGSRRWNKLIIGEEVTSQVYFSGVWLTDDVFRITARWIETCFEKAVELHFIDARVDIYEKVLVGGFGPMINPQEEISAKALTL